MIIDYAQRLVFTQNVTPNALTQTIASWQNYFLNTKTTDGYDYKTFTCSTFTNAIDGEVGTFKIEFPYTVSLEKQLLEFSKNKLTVRAETVQLTQSNVTNKNFVRSTLISAYTGRIGQIECTLSVLTLELINLIDMSTATAPPRKITASLIKGVPSTIRQSF